MCKREKTGLIYIRAAGSSDLPPGDLADGGCMSANGPDLCSPSCACRCTCHPAGRGQMDPLTQPFGTCWTLLVGVTDCKEDAQILAVQQAPVILLQNLQCRVKCVLRGRPGERCAWVGWRSGQQGSGQLQSPALPWLCRSVTLSWTPSWRCLCVLYCPLSGGEGR